MIYNKSNYNVYNMKISWQNAANQCMLRNKIVCVTQLDGAIYKSVICAK